MKVIIETKNLELSSVKSFAEKKFDTLKKYAKILNKEEDKKTLAEVFVEIEKETKHHRKGDLFNVRAQILLPGRSLVVKATSSDAFTSITKAKDLMKLELQQYKAKGERGKRKAMQHKIEI